MLDQRAWLIPMMDGISLAALIAAIVVGLLVKRTRLAISIVLGIAAGSTLMTGQMFEWWWRSLDLEAETLEDRQWIADHDGGRLIVALEMWMKTAGGLIAGGIAVWIRWGITCFSGDEKVQDQTEETVSGSS
jgi:hypothetical protein